MDEARKIIRRLGFYYLLMLTNIPFSTGMVPDIFPLRNLSSIYLLTLCVCLILYYSYRVAKQGKMRTMMTAISWMILLLILIRGIKYIAFAGLELPSRYAWYAYYIPILLIPLFLFNISLLVSKTQKQEMQRKWYAPLVITLVLIGLVLTNDAHQMCFRFGPELINCETDYSYGWVYFAVCAWQGVLYLSAIVILSRNCRVASSKKNVWLTLIPFIIGVISLFLVNTDVTPTPNGTKLIQFPEALAFMVAGVLEVCMQLGLIPTNEKYSKLFQLSSLSAQITDRSGKPVYRSATAALLTPQQFSAAEGTRISEHTVLHRMEIPGGYGFWQNDVTELDEINRKLEEAKEQLSEEATLIRLQNELQEKQAKIEQRMLVYDNIAKQVQSQSQTISRLAEQARISCEEALRDKNRKHIMLLGAYIKRYANLTLISAENQAIAVGEFALSVSEMLRYLNLYGIPGDIAGSTEGKITAKAATVGFEAFASLLETNLSDLKGVTVMLSGHERSVSCKMILENLTVPLSEKLLHRLSHAGIRLHTEQESDAAYILLLLPREGDGA